MQSGRVGKVEQLAREFSRQLWAEIGSTKMKQVIQLNANEKNPSVCHSHDFCDANMVMLAAGSALKFWSEFSFDWEGPQVKLMNEGWALAKVLNFPSGK